MADPATAGSLYLLDAHGLIFQMFHGIQSGMSSADGRPTNAVFGVTRALMSLYDRGADYLIAALDRAEPTFRVALDANSHGVWVSTAYGPVLRLRPSDGRLLAKIHVQPDPRSSPGAVEIDGNNVWVSNYALKCTIGTAAGTEV